MLREIAMIATAGALLALPSHALAGAERETAQTDPPGNDTPGVITNVSTEDVYDRSESREGPEYRMDKATYVQYEFVRYTPGVRRAGRRSCVTGYTPAQRRSRLRQRGRYFECFTNPMTHGWFYERRAQPGVQRFDIDRYWVYPDNDTRAGTPQLTTVPQGYHRLLLTPYAVNPGAQVNGATRKTGVFRVVP